MTALVAIAAMLLVSLGVVLWTKGGGLPPAVSVTLLDYTNRIGPYAILAITNRCESTITLDTQCLVKYGKPIVTSVEPHTLRVTRLGPGEGFVQEVFVFPGGHKAQWVFHCYASRTSTWPGVRRSAEKWFHSHIRRAKYPPRSATWNTFQSDWFPCPP